MTPGPLGGEAKPPKKENERQKGSTTHQKHEKEKLVKKKRSHFEFKFDDFQCIKGIRKVSPLQNRIIKHLKYVLKVFAHFLDEEIEF